MYEIQSERYLGPDVTTRLDTLELRQAGPDRVSVARVRGEAPPERLKVGVNELGGFRNSLEFVLTGLDLDAKADWLRAQLEPALAATSVTWTRTDTAAADASSEEAASCLLRCTVMDPAPEPVGKGFTGPAVELALASYPGLTMTAPPAPGAPYARFRVAYADRSLVAHSVVHADGRREVVADLEPGPAAEVVVPAGVGLAIGGTTARVPLGTFVHARSGDKGGDANLGLWVRHDLDARRDGRVGWLLATVTEEWVRALLPEAAALDVDLHPLPNLGGVNIVLRGLLGEGVAASTRFDPQAKGLGEWARSRLVDVPEELL